MYESEKAKFVLPYPDATGLFERDLVIEIKNPLELLPFQELFSHYGSGHAEHDDC
jgi:hypothetical protein